MVMAIGRGEAFRIGLIQWAAGQGYFVHSRCEYEPAHDRIKVMIRHDQSTHWHEALAHPHDLDDAEQRAKFFDYVINLVKLTAP